jgi:hypothetical protein
MLDHHRAQRFDPFLRPGTRAKLTEFKAIESARHRHDMRERHSRRVELDTNPAFNSLIRFAK